MRDDPATPRVREIGPVNWLGLRTLLEKEVRRFMKVAMQTIVAPVVQTLMFMMVMTLAWGQSRGDILGVSFAEFLAPGLVMMAILTNAFANSSSSMIGSKVQGISVDFLMPPLSPAELTAGFVGGAVIRGVLVGLVGFAAVAPFALTAPANLFALAYFAVAAAIMMGAAGLLAGIWAEKFDHLATVSNFIIMPLTFLSGTFYSVAILPEPLQVISHANPFFHLIDGFRYGFIGASDGSVLAGALTVALVDAVLVAAVLLVLRTGWRLKT